MMVDLPLTDNKAKLGFLRVEAMQAQLLFALKKQLLLHEQDVTLTIQFKDEYQTVYDLMLTRYCAWFECYGEIIYLDFNQL